MEGRLRFETKAHITGVVNEAPNVTAQIPWVYVIAETTSHLLYVGETMAIGGLLDRLGAQFGTTANATFRLRAVSVAGVLRLNGPFVVFAAQLPFDDDAPFDGSSGIVRRSVEAYLHDFLITEFIAEHHKWRLVSSCNAGTVIENPAIPESARSILGCVTSGLSMLQPLSRSAPFQLILLAPSSAPHLSSQLSLDEVLERAEILLHGWVLRHLEDTFSGDWWVKGVPEGVRVECSKIREEEAIELDREAYMTILGIHRTIVSNWGIFGDVMESVSGECGKQRATQWIKDVNELRKVRAHPVKQKYLTPPRNLEATVRTCYAKFEAIASRQS